MADDRIYLKQTVELDSISRNPPGQHAILSHDEQKLAHFGKRQRFRVCYDLYHSCICHRSCNTESLQEKLQPDLYHWAWLHAE